MKPKHVDEKPAGAATVQRFVGRRAEQDEIVIETGKDSGDTDSAVFPATVYDKQWFDTNDMASWTPPT